MQPFPGFSDGAPRLVALPSAFFNDLLPLIDDLAELHVTLFCFWAVQQREGRFRYVRHRELAGHAPLQAALATTAPEIDPDESLAAALDRACARRSLLRAEVTIGSAPEMLYFINAEGGRAAHQQVLSGAWRPGDADHPIELLPERPTIYALYEQNIGPLTPMIADALKDAEHDYPQGWIVDAMRVAVERNARSWRFIASVLDRWRREGHTSGHPADQTQTEGQTQTHETAAGSSHERGERRVTDDFSDFIIR
ncbi:MAG: DnaD domain protein [Chloroflexi bacterium]|nr:DnaD domain protein [Chloroflexota bacterium]